MKTDEQLYTVRCQNQTIPGVEENQARKRLIDHFSLNDKDADNFFQEGTYFERSWIDAFTAKQYLQLFKKIGLQAELIHSNEDKTGSVVSFPVSNREKEAVTENICPKCHSLKTNNEHCDTCGIYFSKYRDRNEQNNPHDTQQANEATSQDGSALTKKILSIGLILFTISFVSDDFLSSLVILGHAGIDLGYYPYLFSALIVSVGAGLLMKQRGYHPWLGIFALTGLPGLGVLTLLPDRKDKKRSGLLNKNNLLGLALIAVGLFWYFGKIESNRSTDTFLALADTLQEGRNEYPSTELDNLANAADIEFSEIMDLFDNGFSLLEQNSFRPDTQEKIAEVMLNEASRFLVWIEYQRYLHVMMTDEVPVTVDKKHFNEYATHIKERAKAGVLAVNSVRLAEVYRRWFTFSIDYNHSVQSVGKLNASLNRLLTDLTMTRALFQTEHNGEMATSEILATLPHNSIDNAQLEVVDNMIRISFLHNHPFANEKPLVLAYYRQPYYRGKKKHYLYKMVQINGEFPNKYLKNNFDVYHGTWTQ